MAETNEDIENVEAWAEVINDLLWLVPIERRAEVLALATKSEESERKKREATGVRMMATPWTEQRLESFKNSPAFRHSGAITRLQSLVVQVFVRDITNNHSAEDAAGILFAPHPYGTGSGALRDYFEDLPRS
jgi:hypothetical protein